MKTTLISFIGKGQVPKEAKEAKEYYYRKTTYDFGGGITYETTCFPDAIRLSGKFEFDKVMLIGTYTSSWSTLLESDSSSEELWLNLKEKEEKNLPLCTEDEKLLRKTLETLWGKKVVLYINEQELREDNCEKLLHHYMGILLDSGSDILLDITHGYRWMPILLTSVLQLSDSYQRTGAGKNIEILYGELGGKVSPVRKLDILTKGQDISNAVALFFQKFEAEPLVKLLDPHWKSGAEAIRKLALNVQGNYFLPLLLDLRQDDFPPGPIVLQLKNALKDFVSDAQPAWVVSVHKELKNIAEKLLEKSAVQRFANLAELLAECRYYGQAVLLVCLAAEQSLIEIMGCKKHPGYYGTEYLKDIFIKEEKQNTRYSSYIGYFKDITNLRNRIAHGGLPDSSGAGGAPQAESLKKQYESILRKQQELYTYLTKSFAVPPQVMEQMKKGEKPWEKKF